MSRRKKEILIEAKDLAKTYVNGEEQVEALRGASIIIHKGEAVTIFGPSGSGKSTLLHLLGGLDRPTSGELTFAGENLYAKNDQELAAFRNKEVGFVFQFHHLLPEFSALENVALPLLVGKMSKSEAYEQANQILVDVGLAKRTDFLPIKLSGGERQRVAVARALVHQPQLVLADEPTGNLDSETERSVMEIFTDLNKRLGVTFIIVSHNPMFKKYTTKYYDLVDGEF